MTINRRILVTVVCAAGVLAGIVGVAAQERRPREGVVQNWVTIDGPGGVSFGGQGDNTFVFVSSEMSFDGKLVKGAPYSAQVVNENVQMLADGNRIVRRNTASVYRDSEGRTRREQTINAVGAYAVAGEPQQTIFINDPVGKVNYILDAKNRVARKLDMSSIGLPAKKLMVEGVKPRDGGSDDQQKEMAKMKIEIAAAHGEVTSSHGEMIRPVPPGMGIERAFVSKFDSRNTKKEALGKQSIEGVDAEGTRYTTTIPAGEIGNDAPINIISESWYSAELQTVVMSRNSDPRFGENTYRLTNITRSEPARSLFEVPSDYTIKEAVPPGMQYKLNVERSRRPEKQDQ